MGEGGGRGDWAGRAATNASSVANPPTTQMSSPNLINPPVRRGFPSDQNISNLSSGERERKQLEERLTELGIERDKVSDRSYK